MERDVQLLLKEGFEHVDSVEGLLQLGQLHPVEVERLQLDDPLVWLVGLDLLQFVDLVPVADAVVGQHLQSYPVSL